MEYRSEIAGLRALAVLLFHADVGLTGGFVGVDVFFVISGCLITTLIVRQTDGGSFSLKEFSVRRIRRIVPALAVMSISVLAVSALFMFPRDLEKLGKSAYVKPFAVANFYFWQAVCYFAGPASLKPSLHTWSLAVEEQFHLVLPLLLWGLRRRPRRIVVGTLVTVALAPFACSVYNTTYATGAVWHWPVFALTKYWMASIPGALTPVLLAVSFFLEWGSYCCVEAPIRTSVAGFGQSKLVRFAVVAQLLIVVVGVGFDTLEGLSTRVSPALTKLDQRNTCASSTNDEIFAGRLKTLGIDDPDKPVTFLDWGDSHRRAMAKFFHEMAEANGLKGYAAIGTNWDARVIPRPGETEIEDRNAQIESLIAEHDVKHIFIVQCWEATYSYMSPDWDDFGVYFPTALRKMNGKLPALADRLCSQGRRVYLLCQPPRQDGGLMFRQQLFSQPYDRGYCEGFFPTDTYEHILVHLPASEYYQPLNTKAHTRADGVSTRDILMISRAGVAHLEESQLAIWERIGEALSSDALKRLVFRPFQRDLALRLGIDEEAADAAPFVSVLLIRGREHYKIKPHPDGFPRLVTMILCLPKDNSQESLGASVYVRELIFQRALRRTYREVKRFPFRPNIAAAFAVNNCRQRKSLHGRELIEAGAGEGNVIIVAGIPKC